MTATLYERLGATPGITRLAGDLVDQHMKNERIATRFAKSDLPHMKQLAATFFIGATGGPQVYEGKDMLSAHKGMNISADEFMAVLDDALAAMDKNKIGPGEQSEVLFAFYSMRSHVMRV
jgi:hemoglobin